MHKKILLLGIVLVSLFSLSAYEEVDMNLHKNTETATLDTITNWQIYLNDSILLKGNLYTLLQAPISVIQVRIDDIQEGDIMKVYFNTCTAYPRTKKVEFINKNGKIIKKLEMKDEVGFVPFILNYSDIKALQSQGICKIQYDESEKKDKARLNKPASSYGSPTTLGMIKFY